MNAESFFKQGWRKFKYDGALAEWVKCALPEAREAVSKQENAQWLRCGGTWFAGVNVLPNSASGALGDCAPLQGAAVEFIRHCLGLSNFDLDRGQISVCYPGYPQPMESESSAAFRYRRDCDAAHVDGLRAEGTARRRHLREHHGFILGIPLVDFSADASPFVVWEKSHEIVRTAFGTRFKGLAPDKWGDEDVTEIYQRTRKNVFATCKRVEIAVKPGQAFVVHRLAMHGVAPWGKSWGKSATSGADGRMICYFRQRLVARWSGYRPDDLSLLFSTIIRRSACRPSALFVLPAFACPFNLPARCL
ncbi:hypothetical protein [Candidatus Spongiihabitans sp.]|uniref:hypothetical protein n=1 Tax=Candidatus Spongiihabitans sp. TaxID=3101308 RepID=UPI003C703C5D